MLMPTTTVPSVQMVAAIERVTVTQTKRPMLAMTSRAMVSAGTRTMVASK
jgi:hypothetical protein